MKRFDQSLANAEADYSAWRESNTNGFILNETPGEWLLHRASCSHLQQFAAFEAELVSTPKSCSTDIAELYLYARQQGEQLRRCSSCSPPPEA